MPTYVFRCAQHGETPIVRRMADAQAPAYCEQCLAQHLAAEALAYPDQVRTGTLAPFVMRRVWNRSTAPAVQNYSKTEGGLVSWGQDERAVKVHKDVWLAEERHNRLEYGPQED